MSALFIAALIVAACNDNVVQLSSQEAQQQQNQTDVVCYYSAPVTFGQHYEAGNIGITNNSNGVTFSIASTSPYNARKIHIKVTTSIGNPGPPGQFPVHINNPTLPGVFTFSWAELGLTYQSGMPVYFYVHIESTTETGWGGDECGRIGNGNGNGKWYCYIPGSMCQ